ncbi:hypothetical protein EV363DRAFT_1367259 [Boletus edulis]|uniref:Uncharacterized protein n=1 Tax=Boletus edulis BED1 TaxID=1328754 RepID=A0AAD4GC79_BOLED|nr:hypothetical protein EV363DRAFT_1375320 [Boletus edulis]KAF8120927.1 hypothetical protein EV363DRAFT_1367259 [Boletus edulis]KAF8436505.1 hypothetical protein L210DRAFT_3548183 [Boletus edulis BED1]
MNGLTKTTPSTTFAPHPSTNVPPATQTFEPLAKFILSHRLFYNIFAYSATFSLASTVFLAGGDDARVFFSDCPNQLHGSMHL